MRLNLYSNSLAVTGRRHEKGDTELLSLLSGDPTGSVQRTFLAAAGGHGWRARAKVYMPDQFDRFRRTRRGGGITVGTPNVARHLAGYTMDDASRQRAPFDTQGAAPFSYTRTCGARCAPYHFNNQIQQ